jgi:hypothetical protein
MDPKRHSPMRASPSAIRFDPLPTRWDLIRHRQIEDGEHLPFASVGTNRNNLSAPREVNSGHAHHIAKDNCLERNPQVLFDRRVEARGLLGLCVRVKDGLLDQGVEVSGRKRPTSAFAWWFVSPGVSHR